MVKVYTVDSYNLGNEFDNKIVFKDTENMEKAFQDVDNGSDIIICKDGVMVKLVNKLLNTKVYDGTLLFCATMTTEQIDITNKKNKIEGGNSK